MFKANNAGAALGVQSRMSIAASSQPCLIRPNQAAFVMHDIWLSGSESIYASVIAHISILLAVGPLLRGTFSLDLAAIWSHVYISRIRRSTKSLLNQ